jgi:SAM-dependent methyltransferase
MPHEKFDVSKIARLDDEARFEYLDPRTMWGALENRSPDVIVDIGAGTGLFSRRFAAMAPQATVFAVDTEPEMVGWISRHPDTDLGGRVRPLLADETRVPRPDASADLVVMVNLHHELAEPLANYREALRLLRPGGELLAADWARTGDEAGPPQEIRASPEQVTALLKAAGFATAVVHGGLPKHWIVTARKNVS